MNKRTCLCGYEVGGRIGGPPSPGQDKKGPFRIIIALHKRVIVLAEDNFHSLLKGHVLYFGVDHISVRDRTFQLEREKGSKVPQYLS